MKTANLGSMSSDELWHLHESVVVELTDRMTVERARLEERLQRLGSVAQGSVGTASKVKRTRRPYPKSSA